MAAAKALVEESDGLNESEKETLNKSLDELLRETPHTEAAILRVKKVLPNSGKAVAEGIKELVKIATETVKSKLSI